jgi:signal transduction histidine kinase
MGYDVTAGKEGSPHRPASPWLALGIAGIIVVFTWVRIIGNADTFASAVPELALAGIALLFSSAGVLIASRRSGSRIGWLLVFIGLAIALDGAASSVVGGLERPPATMNPGLFILLLVNNLTWVAILFPIFLLLCIFPSGELMSRRWLWVPRFEFVTAIMITLLTLASTEIGPVSEAWTMENPIGFADPATIGLVSIPWFFGLFALAGAGVVAMTMRFRQSTYVVRSQIKLVLVAVVIFAVSYALLLIFEGWTTKSSALWLLIPIAFGGIPVAITIAILRYNLFDIDLVISRSLTYGILAVFIGVVYVAIVAGIGEFLSGGEGASAGLSILATALVAFAFQPVRARVERFANRLVYGERATPYEVLARFSQRAAEMSDEDLLERIPRLIVDGTGASHATLWVRSEDTFHAATSWPESDTSLDIEVGAAFADLNADYSLPIFQDGELLGGISLVKERGEAITPAEEELLASLADGMGLALRNTLLTNELRRQVKDLRQSRDRVATAADEARRSLEHDLDSGPQQQLVAVKVKLGPIRMLAEQAGAHKTAKVLKDIEHQAGEAIQAIREFAAGIYPPLLGAEGLAVALGQQTQKAALPVSLTADSIGRYPRDVEAAVYFTILEALQNTAKYARASSAEVRVIEENGDLRFEVADDGIGFDMGQVTSGAGLNGISDRMDTVGGTWHVESVPGTGTKVKGTVPVRDPEKV